MKFNRRSFVIHSVLGSAALAAGAARAQGTKEKVSESDPQAASLGYKDNAANVDKAKFPKYQPGQQCAGCQFYQAAGGSSDTGPCAVFGGKLVSAKGWCSAYVKKAG